MAGPAEARRLCQRAQLILDLLAPKGLCLMGCSTTRARSRHAATTPMAAGFRPCLRPLLLARVSVRAADPGSEEPAALQLRQGGGLSVARTTNRRAHQHSAHPRPLAGNPAGCRLDPYGHRGRLPDLATAHLLPAARRPRSGTARAGAAGTHAVHSRLAGGCGTAPSDQPGTQQGRNTRQPGAGCLHSSPRRDPRPAPTRTSNTALRASTSSSPQSSCETRDISSAPLPLCARPRMFQTSCSLTSPRSAGSM